MITLQDFLTATGATLHGPANSQRFTDFCFDSRIVEPGQLFLAVVTATGDGHDYIVQACQAGATGVVCQRVPPDLPPQVTCILVEDTQQALLDYARYLFSTYALDVVAVTGSVGKTSTKEAVAAVLARRHSVCRSHDNYNGRFGLPISLGRWSPEQRLAVLELAADSYDEVRELAEISRPRVGIVTAVGASHLEYFGSLEAVSSEKGRLVEALPSDGVAILNADDARVLAMRERTRARVVTYGLSEHADLRADEICVSPAGTDFSMRWNRECVHLSIPYLGAHHVHTALAAAAVGISYDLSWADIRQGLASLEPLPGRTRLLRGLNGSTLLDDSYNASPASTLAGLQLLADLPAKRRFVVLGDMAQLADSAESEHRAAGRRIAQVASGLWTKGELARIAGDEARRAGMSAEQVTVTYTPSDIVRDLGARLQSGDLVLFKGSAQERLEVVVAQLLADPDETSRRLPRQNSGWSQVRIERPGRPTWVEIDLEAIARNTRRIREWVGDEVRVMAVLKADAYGHGALKVARTALNNGASWLGVACVGEAVTLRRAGIESPILTLGFTPAWQAREAILHDVTTTVFSIEVAHSLARAGADLDRRARVHVKVDTGMGRLGLFPNEVVPFTQGLQDLANLEVDGIFTHFSSADDADLSYTRWQIERFDEVLADLREGQLLPRHIHAANSAAVLRLRESHYNMVRPGIALYGLSPSREARCPVDFRSALTLKCQIAQVKTYEAGAYISYGRTFRTERVSRIAVIPVGYADGFRRAPHHWQEVLVRGHRAPIVGRVCMDQTMIDVTQIPGVRQGDEVVLIGAQGREEISIGQVAERLGTINYEVVSEILARVPRMV